MTDSARERAERVANERTFHVGIRVARNVARDLLAALERVDALTETLRQILVETDFPQDAPQRRWVKAVSRIQHLAGAAVGEEPG